MRTSQSTMYGARVAQWCLRTIHLQLFLTLFSLPILVAWGLPLSVLSPLGNIVFAPFLSIFLLLSSLVFFGTLLHIPHYWCTLALDHFTSWWLTLMSYGSAQYMIGIVRLPMPVLIGIALSPLCIVTWYTGNMYRSTFSFLLILSALYGYAWYTTRCNTPMPIITFPCQSGQRTYGELTLIRLPQATVLIDPGCVQSLPNAASWMRYTFIPHLIATTGITAIDHFIMLQPSGRAFEAAEQLSAYLHIKTVHLPAWEGTMKPHALKQFGMFRKTLTEHQTHLLRFNTHTHAIALGQHERIVIEKVDSLLTSGESSFHAYVASTQIDNQEVTIYSAKYKTPPLLRDSPHRSMNDNEKNSLHSSK